MQIHDISPKNKIKKSKRIGRGGKRGTYSGKGMKGQKSRAGAKMKPIIRGDLKRYPKLRGYNFSQLKKTVAINIAAVDKVFKDKEKVSPKTLVKKGLVKKSNSLPVKIIGDGKIKKKFFVENCFLSEKAKETIEKAGGKVMLKK